MFIIVYARIIDNKKQGLEMEGPFLGPEASSMDDAHSECEVLVTESKNHTIVRIYDLNVVSEQGALDKARESFDKIYGDMEIASRLIERPIIKRKKKKPKPKATHQTS